MSAPSETIKTTAPTSGPESPTTARPLEMDDDDVQEYTTLGEETNTQKPAAAATATPAVGASTATGPHDGAPAADAPPTKPPRPISEAEKNVLTLKEAFPTVDTTVIKAVLSASRGQIEPAFHALLEMTDPDAAQNEPEERPPVQPPRPVNQPPLTQLEADELYARQLAEHYENVGAYEERTTNREHGEGRPRRQQTGFRPQQHEGDDRERNFFDDELPVIQEKLKKGFVETQGKVNTWITTLKKKFDEQFDEEEEQRQRPPTGQYRRAGEPSRRSGDYERYDADPQVLSDDFAGMKFTSDGTPVRNDRPLANPNLYRPPPSTSPRPSDGRKVAFKDGAEEIDVYESSPHLPPKDGASAAAPKTSKWQPLSAVEPSPIAENDPFSLGDSEDEREAKDKTGTKEIKMEDTERLKKAAAEAMADNLVDPKPQEDGVVATSAKKD